MPKSGPAGVARLPSEQGVINGGMMIISNHIDFARLCQLIKAPDGLEFSVVTFDVNREVLLRMYGDR